MISEPFGTTRDGRTVLRHRLRNARGTEAVFIDLGATLTSLHLMGPEEKRTDVVVGFDTLADFETPRTWFGCVVGRVANRIAGARFEIDGVVYDVEANEAPNQLHGGSAGLSTRVWSAAPVDGDSGIRFTYSSPDGEAGYPGRVDVEVVYRLTDDDRLRIEYGAEVDRPTPVNLTHHAYWNLAGRGDVLGHTLEIAADRHVEVDDALIPTGELPDVSRTPFDFRRAKPVGRDFGSLDGDGYDLSFVLPGFDESHVGETSADLAPPRVARLFDPGSGRRVDVSTTAPCLQLYTGQYLDGRSGKAGLPLRPFAGLCLEAQHPPDALHHGHFPSVVCRPGAAYRQVTEYAFGRG